MIAAVVLGMLAALALTALASARGTVEGRFVAVQLASIIGVQLIVVLSLQPHISYYADVALLLAIVSAVGTLLFARFLERWL